MTRCLLARLEAKEKGGAANRAERGRFETAVYDGGAMREARGEGGAAERKRLLTEEAEERRDTGGKGVGAFGATRMMFGAAGQALSGLGAAVQPATTLMQIRNEPFITEHDRFWKKAGMVPGVSQLRDFQLELQKFGSGKSEYTHRLNVFEHESRDEVYRRPFETFADRWHLDKREAERRFLLSTVQKVPLPSASRETLGDSRLYREQMALLPAKDAAERAGRESQAVAIRGAELQRRQARHQEEIDRLEGIRVAALRRAEVDNNDGGLSRKEALTEAVDAARGQVTHRRMLTGLDDEKRQLDERLATARKAERDSSRAVLSVELDQLRDRESTARGQAANLGLLGVDGRMQAILAKQIVDQIGIENAPQTLIGQASAAFPETVRKQAEQAGQQFQPQFKELGGEEYQDDVKEVTSKVNELTQRIRDQDRRDTSATMLELLKAVEEMFGRDQRLRDEFEALKQLFITESTLKNSR